MATAVEATTAEPQELSALEIRDRMAVPGDGRAEMPYRDRAWICNLTDMDWPIYYFQYGQFGVRGRGKATEQAIMSFLKSHQMRDTPASRAEAVEEISCEPYAMTTIT